MMMRIQKRKLYIYFIKFAIGHELYETAAILRDIIRSTESDEYWELDEEFIWEPPQADFWAKSWEEEDDEVEPDF